jgi:hypothetical protein
LFVALLAVFLPLMNVSAASAICDMVAYQKVTSACFTGRATGFYLPKNEIFGPYSGRLTSSWNFGSYSPDYRGPSFRPAGDRFNPNLHRLPPYSWGAVGQLCDYPFDPATHDRCVAEVGHDLSDPSKNASYAADRFYWRAHGHNCHDAVEDVATCLLNATAHMAENCGFEAKIVVWDPQPDIEKALGDVYHSQILVKRTQEDAWKRQMPMVCLEEAQEANPSGKILSSCCNENLAIFDGGTIDDYVHAFRGCPDLLVQGPGVFPHLYEVAKFRRQRQIGEMDVPSGYDRLAGVKALARSAPAGLGGAPPSPKILGIVYDKNGFPLMLNVGAANADF